MTQSRKDAVAIAQTVETTSVELMVQSLLVLSLSVVVLVAML